MQHEFAFFIQTLSSLIAGLSIGDTITITDQDLVHRIVHVVRIEQGQRCVLFDRDIYIKVSLEALQGKKAGRFIILTREDTIQLTPAITALIPILRREAFELVCYNLAELGITTIQPLITRKIQRSWGGTKEAERLKKIIVAAAEQSKHFKFPLVNYPITLEAIPTANFDALLYADPQGEPLWQIVQTLRVRRPNHLAFMIGPEGDLTQEEKNYITQQGFIFCALTQTVLRSHQAATLLAGCMRSLL
ncbi:RsmE family RNA methyltransferase [Candidatus Dependentiae bacterium]|nr:RsmE family RNA methyltransferase [Candidatus Dependentiae bacterium]